MLETEAAHGHGTLAALHKDRLWRDEGWMAQGLKHLGDDCCAAPTTRRGHEKRIPMNPSAPGCDKNDPGPLNMATINMPERATGEVPRRAQYALPHKNVTVVAECESNTARVVIVTDHDEPPSMLAANNRFGEQRARAKVQLSLDAGGTSAWIESRYAAPR